MRIDLHTHSIASDGTETPADVARSAKAAGLDVFALTDHDTTAGWQEAGDTAVTLGLAFVPGMEITCTTSNGVSVHMLSYLHDPTHEPLLTALESSRTGRLTRARRMVELLSADYDITWGDVERHMGADATVGRPHIADALVEHLDPQGVMVVIEAEHQCMTMRGVRKPGSSTVTSAVRGALRNAATRAEAMGLIIG